MTSATMTANAAVERRAAASPLSKRHLIHIVNPRGPYRSCWPRDRSNC